MNISTGLLSTSNHLQIKVPSTAEMANRNHKTTDDSANISDQAKALQKLAAFPAWAGNYLPKVNILNNDRSHEVGYSQWASDYRSAYANELNEYSERFNAALDSTKTELGIANREDYFDNVLNTEAGSDQFRKVFTSKLFSDTRTTELMRTLGIDPTNQ